MKINQKIIGVTAIVIAVILTSIVFYIVIASPFFDQPNKTTNSEFKIPKIYKQYELQSLKLEFGKNVKTAKDFDSWRQKVLDSQEIEHQKLNYIEITTNKTKYFERENYGIWKYEMKAHDGDKIIFYELLPVWGEGKRDAVLIIPGTGNGGAKDVMGEPSEYEQYYYHDEIAKKLVQNGYVVYVIELRGYGERQIPITGNPCSFLHSQRTIDLECSERILSNYLLAYDVNIHELDLQDISRVLKFIKEREFVDQIAVGGLSLGGSLAQMTAMYYRDDIDAVIIASGTGSIKNYLSLEFQSKGGELVCCDLVDRTATIAPLPMYVSFGKQESALFAWEYKTQYSAKFLQNVYDLLDAHHQFFYVSHSGTHQFDIDSILKFLDKVF